MGNGTSTKKFGIDLGTTYSSIGWFDLDTRQIQIGELDSAQGTKLLPSAVFVERADNIVVGTAAVHAGVDRPDRLFRWFKRDIGIEGLSPRIIDGKPWAPVECSTEILKTLKREAETYFVTEVKDVVITFPAWFTPQQKDLTRDAAIQAGLNVIRMIEEPQAAALAYVLEEILRQSAGPAGDLGSLVPQIVEKLAGGKGAVLVYDLGGGTFDVAMVQAWGTPQPDGNTELHIKTLYNEGDIALGGKDWDVAIRQIVSDLDQQQNNHDPLSDPQSGMLDDACEQAKQDLSRRLSLKVLCPQHHQVELTRQQVEEATESLLERTRQITETVLGQAEQEHGIRRDQVIVLLSGGMTRWPAVKDMLTKLMGRPPLQHRNPDFLVTHGASYLAYLTLTTEERAARGSASTAAGAAAGGGKGMILPVGSGAAGITLTGIEAEYPAIGIRVVDTMDGKKQYVCKVMPSNSKPGDVARQTFATVYDNQSAVDITVYFLKEREGYKDDETDFSAWKEYKSYQMSGLPPRPKGEKVQVELRYQEGGVIDGEAWDDFGNKVAITGLTSR